MMLCTICGGQVAKHTITCPNCGTGLGFPNVRAADDPSELTALTARYDQVCAEARARGADFTLTLFETSVKTDSRAIICRPLGTLYYLLASGDGLFQTFYNQVKLGRIPEDNKWDRFRTSVDNLLFPYYHERIHFAALTIGTVGATGYGAGRNCALLLNETIQNRASVFEENCYLFCEKNNQAATEALPHGFRATWANRHRLAVAKLGPLFTPRTTSKEFPRILLKGGATTADDKFVEVHIHDPLTAVAVEKVHLPKIKSGLTKSKEKVEKTLLKAVKERLDFLGVHFEVV